MTPKWLHEFLSPSAARRRPRSGLRVESLESRTVPTVSYSTAGSVYSQNFNGLPNTGTFDVSGSGTTPVALDAAPISATGVGTNDWFFARTGGDTTRFEAGDGSSGTGAAVSYGAAGNTERALGLLASDTNTSVVGVVFVNNTGGALTSFTLTYTTEQWRRGDNPAGGVLEFAYSVGGSSITSGTFVDVPTLNSASPNRAAAINTANDGDAAANRRTVTVVVGGFTWANGETFVLRWSDINNRLSDDALALDDVSFSASGIALAVTSGGSGASAAIAQSEASVGVTTVTSNALASGATRTYSVSGGADVNLFQIDPATGALRFKAAPFFSNPADANGDNVYQVVVRVVAGPLVDDQALTVTVLNTAGISTGVNDSYTFTPNTPLVVTAATGVLANDRIGAGTRVTVLSERFEGFQMRPHQSPTEGREISYDPGSGAVTVASDGTDWSPDLPVGWVLDLAGTPIGNPIELRGWRVNDADSWLASADGQERWLFTKGGIGSRGSILVVDGDEYDDGTELDTGVDHGAMNATLNLPAIPLTGIAANSVRLEFDSSFRPEDPGVAGQRGRLQWNQDGGNTFLTLLDLNDTPAGGTGFEFINLSYEEAAGAAFNLGNATSGDLRLRFNYLSGNDWWWAIDNLRVTATKTETAAAAVISNPANGAVTLNADGSFTFTPNAGFAGTDSFVYRPTAGGSLTKVTVTAGVATPQQGVVRVNGTTAPASNFTASRVTSLTVAFNTAIGSVDASAFTLARSGANPVSIANGSGITVSGIGTATLTLTFTGSTGVESGSLADGVWTLTTDLTKVRNAANAAGSGTSTTANIRRLYGDVTGDGQVNTQDYVFFDLAFGSTDGQPAFVTGFDWDGNGQINSQDYVAFDLNFGNVLP